MDNVFGNVSWQDLGIDIDELNKTMENPDTVDLPDGIHHGRDYSSIVKPKSTNDKDNSFAKAMGVCGVLLIVIALLIVAMCTNADAGAAFMQFKVVAVTDKIIQVEDEHGDTFTFHADKSPEVKVGDEVMVCTDLTYVSNGGWKWNTKRTAIIDIVK